MEDEDSIMFQQIDIREKYAVGKHPEFMMYGVTQVRLFACPFPRDINLRISRREATASWHILLGFFLTSLWPFHEAFKKKTLSLLKSISMYFTHPLLLSAVPNHYPIEQGEDRSTCCLGHYHREEEESMGLSRRRRCAILEADPLHPKLCPKSPR